MPAKAGPYCWNMSTLWTCTLRPGRLQSCILWCVHCHQVWEAASKTARLYKVLIERPKGYSNRMKFDHLFSWYTFLYHEVVKYYFWPTQFKECLNKATVSCCYFCSLSGQLEKLNHSQICIPTNCVIHCGITTSKQTLWMSAESSLEAPHCQKVPRSWEVWTFGFVSARDPGNRLGPKLQTQDELDQFKVFLL